MRPELATALAELQTVHREWSALRSEGNPNHKGSGEGGGQFTTGPGGGGSSSKHGKHWARRQKRKAKLLAKLKAAGHAKIAKLREKQRAERKSLREKQRADKISYAQRRTAHKELSAKHKGERRHTIAELKAEVRKEVGKIPNPAHPKVKELREKKVANEIELKKRIVEHAAKGEKSRQDGDTRTVAEHDRQRKELVQWSRKERAEIRAGHAAKSGAIVAEMKEQWRSDLESMKESRREVIRDPGKVDRWKDIELLQPFTTPEGFRAAVNEAHADLIKRTKAELSVARTTAREEIADHKADFAAEWSKMERSHRKEWRERADRAKSARKYYANMLKEVKSEWAAKDVAEIKGRALGGFSEGGDHGWGTSGDILHEVIHESDRGRENGPRQTIRDSERAARGGADWWDEHSGVERAVLSGHGIAGRFSAAKLHKASSAESILAHCLKQRGWTARYRDGRLTGRQHPALLEDVRQYGRAWLRHEAEAFFGRYSVEAATQLMAEDQMAMGHRSMASEGSIDSEGSEGRGINEGGFDVRRSLSDRVLSPLRRWFDRMRQFVRELMFAGTMSLLGRELNAQESGQADQLAKVQDAYFDGFERELIASPPQALQEPTNQVPGPEPARAPQTPGQATARAESYANSVWEGAQRIKRTGVIQGATERWERLRLGKPKTHHCSDCPPDAALGWVPVGTLRPIGDRECENLCLCYIEYSDSVEKPAPPAKKPPGPARKPRIIIDVPGLEHPGGPLTPDQLADIMSQFQINAKVVVGAQ
jgi:hypothetical protein